MAFDDAASISVIFMRNEIREVSRPWNSNLMTLKISSGGLPLR